MSDIKIEWKVFEKGQERDDVRKLYEQGHLKMIPSVIVHMTLEKEQEIQKMIDVDGRDVLEMESDVLNQMKEVETKTGVFPIQTPEDEETWQKKLDAERASRAKLKNGSKLTDVRTE